jgi:hypothetical protein
MASVRSISDYDIRTIGKTSIAVTKSDYYSYHLYDGIKYKVDDQLCGMTTDEYFTKGYHVDRYHALEKDLIRFFEYLPLDFYANSEERKRIRSTYLADLLLRIGSNIDIFF